jgi:hypothetical protein
MNIVAIDPSLSCTAVVVNDKKCVFVNDTLVTTESGKTKKWFAAVEDLCEFRVHPQFQNVADNSTNEINKLNHYDEISDTIISFINANIDHSTPTLCAIEGYSHSSMVGPLIDLVTLSTLIRTKLIHRVDEVSVVIVTPSQLKLKAAKLTYPEIKKGKKVEYRNNDGVAGGSFKKKEMYTALTDNTGLNCEWVKFLRDSMDEIMCTASVPKPIEDINDAKLLYEIVKADLIP